MKELQIHHPDYEGFPAWPLEVDDDYITAAGSFPQPRGIPSLISSHSGIIKLFPIMAECLMRQKRLKQFGHQLNWIENLSWVDQTTAILNTYLDTLPLWIRDPQNYPFTNPDHVGIFGMAKANIVVTLGTLKILLVSE